MAKKKVLLVDDEIDFLQLLKARLEANSYNVVTAMNGREALEKFRREKPDALILDVMMPEINGLEVLREIRKEDQKIPIFIITAFSNEERFKAANQFNASGFILKTGDLQSEIDNINVTLGIAEKYKK
ncbi:MAG: response regulator [Candidatus Omnitrophota bacterium]|jgi:two-component system alkaline phosphatase synthesis response regulator PhoP